MIRRKRIRALALGVTLSLGWLCASCASSSHSLAVLDSSSSGQPVPAAIEGQSTFASGSIRFLASSGTESFFVAKSATAPEHEVCLVRFNEKTSDWVSGCSTVGNDLIVTVSSPAAGAPQVALVGDNPSVEMLEDQKWQKLGENIWLQSTS